MSLLPFASLIFGMGSAVFDLHGITRVTGADIYFPNL